MKLHRFSTYLVEDLNVNIEMPSFDWNTDILDYFNRAREKFKTVIEDDIPSYLATQISNLFQEKDFEVSKIKYESDRFFMLIIKKMHYVLEVTNYGKIKTHFIENYSQDPEFLKDITWFNNHKEAAMDNLNDALEAILKVEMDNIVYIRNSANNTVRLKREDFKNRDTFAKAMVNQLSKEPKLSMTVFNPVWINNKKEKFTYIDGNYYFE